MNWLTPGSRVGLQGRSGEGKSRFFRWLAGLEARVEWSEAVTGVSLPGTPEEWRAWRLRVQLVPQRIFAPTLAVREYLVEPASFRLFRERSGAQRLEEAPWLMELQKLGLPGTDDFLRRPMSQLSGGELTRVALIRSLVMDPQFLLLDEVAAALDPGSIALVEARLLEWWQERPSVRGWILCSHDSEHLARLCTQAARLVDFSFQEVTLN